ncbi:DNA-binding transcriptional ArsR family regulator [Mycobacterium frederiksbergense]|uniref:DNA-binding transcriptional ArsR family regulator n=1 Tax=Mycolicibacterium frederiksbergense TaxID=117567 RepID=A0ABT6L7J6_9MYCO|nr:metalloregulator ArsR/SmtB family transcription factor [Mycolicibacterium frederiksbergense]MDH6198929.1 DNA-binding transcriptional ArsR family regulator [Mycolicibacterium frederiksbergense]
MAEPSADSCDLLCLDLPNAESIRTALPDLGRVEPAAAAARALSDPTRLTIAAALYEGGELCVCDMGWVVGAPQNLVSHHLRQLKVAGMVSSRRNGRLVMYRLTDHGRRLTAAVLAVSAGAESGRV